MHGFVYVFYCGDELERGGGGGGGCKTDKGLHGQKGGKEERAVLC